ncbi:MAG TPA: hypothetical protein VGZ71_09210, partial [Puia sp.]|nr:hypothetical protein [Puia sp.]
MCLRHKIFIPILISLMFGSALNASSFLSSFRKLFSVELSKDLLDSVNKDMLGSLHVKNMRFFLPNRVELDDVEVLDENGKRVLYSKQVQLQVSLLSLITKNITITNAHIKEPFFNYSVAHGIHNVLQAFKSPKPQENKKGDWRVNVSYVQVENGTFEMEHDANV